MDEDSRAKLVEVETDISDDSHYVILSGISVGEKVVTGPYRAVSRLLKPGELIEERDDTPTARNGQ